MEIKAEVGVSSISKQGEEVCGDTTQIIETADSTVVILSDGLGSGIKASILSILSTRIAARLLKTDLGAEEVFATIANTLPTCQERGIAYSTLSILIIKQNGTAHLIEYDNPTLLLIRNEEIVNIEKKGKTIAGKEVQEAYFQLKLEDILILLSDGVINAGVGGLFPLGLGKDRLIDNILPFDLKTEKPQTIADRIITLTKSYYLQEPGDDSTAMVIKCREKEKMIVFTGPPEDEKKDSKVVEQLISSTASRKVICGGTTAQIVARELEEEIETSMEYIDTSVPPIAQIEGIDLVTEGILTLNKSLEKLKEINRKRRKKLKESDGATRLVKNFFQADEITFLMGTSFNPAHKELMKTMQIMPRNKTVGKLINQLKDMDKKVNLEVF